MDERAGLPSATDLELRPPRARTIPEAVWIETQHGLWCKARADLIRDGHTLLHDLQQVAPDAPTKLNDTFTPKVKAWQAAFRKVIGIYWDANNPDKVVSEAQGQGAKWQATAIGPEWAKAKAGLIGAPVAWLEAQPNDCDPPEVSPSIIQPLPPRAVPRRRSGDDAQDAKEEIEGLIEEGNAYAEQLRALELDPDDDGYQAEDEKLVKAAEEWVKRSQESEDYWYAPGLSISSMSRFARLLDDSGAKSPVRRPVWRQQFVLRIEGRLDDLRARLK